MATQWKIPGFIPVLYSKNFFTDRDLSQHLVVSPSEYPGEVRL